MILYCDTSALVKLFVDESDSGFVREAVAASAGVVTHMIAYAEACAAYARLGALAGDERLFTSLRRALDDHWLEWQIVEVDEALVRRAGDLAGAHRLRGFDSVHLASAEAVFRVTRSAQFRFVVFDGDLIRAARTLGMPLLQV